MGAAKSVLDLAQQTHRDMAVGFDDNQMALLFGTSVDYLLELTDTSAPYPRRKAGMK